MKWCGCSSAIERWRRLTFEELVAASPVSPPAADGQDKGEIATPHAER